MDTDSDPTPSAPPDETDLERRQGDFNDALVWPDELAADPDIDAATMMAGGAYFDGERVFYTAIPLFSPRFGRHAPPSPPDQSDLFDGIAPPPEVADNGGAKLGGALTEDNLRAIIDGLVFEDAFSEGPQDGAPVETARRGPALPPVMQTAALAQGAWFSIKSTGSTAIARERAGRRAGSTEKAAPIRMTRGAEGAPAVSLVAPGRPRADQAPARGAGGPLPENQLDLRVRINHHIWSSETATVVEAVAEFAGDSRRIRIHGPVALRHMSGHWVAISGRWRKDDHGQILIAENIWRDWPVSPLTSAFALVEIVEDALGGGRDPERRGKIIDKAIAMIGKTRGILQEMECMPGPYIAKISEDKKEREAITIHWLRLTGQLKMRHAIQQMGIGGDEAKRIVWNWRDDLRNGRPINPYSAVDAGVLMAQAEILADIMGKPGDRETNAAFWAAGFMNEAMFRATRDGSTAVGGSVLLRDLPDIHPAKSDNDMVERLKIAGASTIAGASPISYGLVDGAAMFCRRVHLQAEVDFGGWVAARVNAHRKVKEDHMAAYMDAKATLADQAALTVRSERGGASPTPGQIEAVVNALLEPVSLVSSGPGASKTAVIRASIAMIRAIHPDAEIITLSTTLNGAQRLSDETGMVATTINGRLGIGRIRGDEAVADTGQIPNNSFVIIGDAATLDCAIAGALAQVMPQGARLLLIGDGEQIGPPGAGQVFRDALAAGAGSPRGLPVTTLSDDYHTPNSIAAAWDDIRRGRVPQINFVSEASQVQDDSWGLIECQSHEITARIVGETQSLLRAGVAMEDILILTPQHRRGGGGQEINAALSAALNPDGQRFPASSQEFGSLPARTGDRIVATGTYAEERSGGRKVALIVNGDTGTILGAEGNKITVKVDGGDAPVELPVSMLSRLMLGYAGTIHRMRGGRRSHVIMAANVEHLGLLDRRLLQTGWSMAENKLLIVGQEAALARAVANHSPSGRTTMLGAYLDNHLADDSAIVARPGVPPQQTFEAPQIQPRGAWRRELDARPSEPRVAVNTGGPPATEPPAVADMDGPRA